jgi:hypothetical protein
MEPITVIGGNMKAKILNLICSTFMLTMTMLFLKLLER